MVLFYAWTNVLLLNSVNAKVNFFGEEKADLLIRSNSTLSQNLLDTIKKNGFFRKIYFVDMPRINKKRGILGKIPKLRVLGIKKPMQQFYKRYIMENFTDEPYDKLITGGLWNDILYILPFLYQKNPGIEVEFLEEGERSYEGIKSLCVPVVTDNWKRKLVEYYNVGWDKRKYQKNIKNTIYLYRPERYEEDANLKLKKLPEISREQNNICFMLLDHISDKIDYSMLLRYIKRPVIYFGNYLVPEQEANYDMAYRIIYMIIRKIGQGKLMIKPHTNVTDHRINFAKKYQGRVYIDRNVYLFESMYTKMELEHKIFIAKHSTVLSYAKQLFDKEPYLFFTYRLFDYYHEHGDDISDRYVMSLKRLYRNPEKIIVPNSMLEFENKLREVYETNLNDKYCKNLKLAEKTDVSFKK